MIKVLHAAILLAVSVVCAGRLSGQQADSGRVRISIEESMGMVGGFRVQSVGKTAITDANGAALLTLPVGRQLIAVTQIGFKPSQVTVVVVRDSLVSVKVTVSMSEMAMPEVRVSAARTERLAGETPIRVDVVDEMEVDEKTLMAPSGLGMLLNETPGLRVQASAPGLGTGSVRILGLPGQYTMMLADGLPLYGSSTSALGPLDISPVDLQRVEIIKGAASALYGGQALGGVINLISKPATGRKELLLNRRTMSVTDAATWLSHRFGTGAGLSLLATGTTQGAQDVDGDGWADQSHAQRWSVRPRLSLVDRHGRTAFVTAGFGYDNRAGGTLGGAVAPDGLPFREALQSTRADIGASARIPFDAGSLAMRLAFATNSRQREFGFGPREDDNTTTGFLEVTRSFDSQKRVLVVGSAIQFDGYNNALNATFDRRWLTPGVFVTTEHMLGSFNIAASVRADAHPDAGVQLTERLSILARPVEGWSIRGSVGTAYSAATARTEETEATGLRAIRSVDKLEPEQSRGAMFDVGGPFAGIELLVTAYGSTIARAIQLHEAPAAVGQAILQNAEDNTNIGGIEALAVWRFALGRISASYGHARGSSAHASGVRHAMPMLARHRAGADVMLERVGVYRIGVEGTWYGRQELSNNPFRSTSKPYLYTMAMASRQFGPVELVINFENLLNVRQTDTDPLVRPTRGMAGRWTTDVWAPLEGFMANVAIRYRWE